MTNSLLKWYDQIRYPNISSITSTSSDAFDSIVSIFRQFFQTETVHFGRLRNSHSKWNYTNIIFLQKVSLFFQAFASLANAECALSQYVFVSGKSITVDASLQLITISKNSRSQVEHYISIFIIVGHSFNLPIEWVIIVGFTELLVKVKLLLTL